MAARALGYRQDAVDEKDYDMDKLGLASAPAADEHTLMASEPPIYNQFSSNSCVGQALGGSMHNAEIRAAARGVDIVPAKPSVLSLYYQSRVAHDGRQVRDTGTYPRTAMSMAFKLGVPDDAHWPFSTIPFTVNRRPPMGATMRGLGRKGGEYYRIKEAGEGRITAIIAALHAGHTVFFGTRVTHDFLNSSGPTTIDVPRDGAAFAGGHAMVIVGYERTDKGLRFLVRNSWGTRWRQDGYCYFTEDYVRWVRLTDLYVVVGWNLLKESA